jgi:hypothetical protein
MPRREEATTRSPLPDLSDSFGGLLRLDAEAGTKVDGEAEPAEAGALQRSLLRVRARSNDTGQGTSMDFQSAIG